MNSWRLPFRHPIISDFLLVTLSFAFVPSVTTLHFTRPAESREHPIQHLPSCISMSELIVIASYQVCIAIYSLAIALSGK